MLKKDLKIQVVCDGDILLKASTSFAEIKTHAECADETTLRIFDNSNQCLGAAQIINGLEDDEIVADYTVNDLLQEWDKQYYRHL